ncbi:MAG: hypothetical protein L6Q94_05715 [Calditrichia bacterium]|nr:hypothetical protein [Calditrichia bacterium]
MKALTITSASKAVNFISGVLLFHLVLLFPLPAQQLDMKLLHGLKPRSIGPAGMSGRVTAIDAVLRNPDIIYVGTASGGLWKSTSGGVAWQPVFDEQPVASIGAVAVDQQNPDVVWVGTGEGNPRNSHNSGNGIYKSLDGGKTWQHLGLDNTRNVHRVIVHPQNSDIAYVAALGSAWGENPERGVYKTSDGGKTWKQILYLDAKTGAADLVMDPSNPNKLFAAMWEYRRWPWFFKSGGPGSGLYVTFDGGETWKKRSDKDGLPEGEFGRIGLAVARSNPDVVYALIEAKKNGLYRSDDGGFKWRKTADKNIGNRPFYYAEIYVDPSNENRLYNLYSIVSVSEDGGKTFQTLIPWNKIHPDHHAWWIHPADPDFMIDGNDGGLAITHDRGKTWRFVENLPLAQFYHINVDMETPYNVYGGMQDNGSWRGPGQVWREGGIRNSYWEEVGFGDGFDVLPDPADSRRGYAMWQGGNLMRYNSLTGEIKYIRPVDPPGVKLRFNWNAGIAADPFDPAAIYYGSQFLHKSANRGDSWETISPDLTTNDPEKQRQFDSGGLTYDVTNAENHTTIIAIAPSPLQQGVIWVGTDDGNVQLTRDGGKSWVNVAKNIKGAPEGCWVPQIRASTYDAGEALAVLNNYRRDDWAPYVYQTKDFGKTWKRLVEPGEIFGYALAIAQDPVEPKLLFLGGEFGLYLSIDGGENWSKWTNGYPTVSTMDLAIHPRDHDLVIGTFGRAAYILDDLRPLRELARKGPGLLNSPLHVFSQGDGYPEAGEAALAVYKEAAGTRFAGEAEFSGENRPYGALISFAVKFDTAAAPAKIGEEESEKAAEGEGRKPASQDTAKIEILNAQNEAIRTFKAAAKNGVNRTFWDLSRKGMRFPETPQPGKNAPEPSGAAVSPGDYKIRVSFREHKDSTAVKVKFDPRIQITPAELQRREDLLARLQRNVEIAAEAADRLREAQKSVELVSGQLKERSRRDGYPEDEAKSLRDKSKAVKDSLKALLEKIVEGEVQGIRPNPALVNSKLERAAIYIQWGWQISAEADMSLNRAEESVKTAVAQVNRFFEQQWPEFRRAVEAAEFSFFKDYPPISTE